jgi:hypothetical protein
VAMALHHWPFSSSCRRGHWQQRPGPECRLHVASHLRDLVAVPGPVSSLTEQYAAGACTATSIPSFHQVVARIHMTR